MKNFSIIFLSMVMAMALVFTGCNSDEETPEPVTNDCDGATGFPASTGNATVSFINFPGVTEIVEINASAGDVLSIAVNLVKGAGNRPQKLRAYATGCEDKLGTQVSFPGQPQTEDNDMTIDLRNTDSQVRTVLYTVPSGVSPLYLNFEADLSGGLYNYKRLKINVSGSGVIDAFNNITLGSQNNAAPSRSSSSTGYVYLACETEANINTIDLTFAIGTTDSKAYLSSNPARFNTPIGLSTTSISCTDDGTVMTNGGNAVYFVAAPSVDFDAATDATLQGLSITSSDNQYVEVIAGNVYGFLRSDGKKGLVRVDAISAAGVNGVTDKTITFDVKVQR